MQPVNYRQFINTYCVLIVNIVVVRGIWCFLGELRLVSVSGGRKDDVGESVVN